MIMREFAGYRIVRVLGSGGMTRLYVAMDDLQNRVVLRHLLDHCADNRTARQQFFDGADLLRRLNHPNIIKVLKTGSEGDIPFMILEYVESRTLRDLLLSKDFLLTQNALSLIRQLAAALAYVHDNGYLHLDIKPENILVRPDGRLVLIDFDLAIKIRRWFKRISQVPGTPAYVAPETLTKHVVDERSDIFSFGVTCYEMLTFHKPFETARAEQALAAQVDPHIPPTPPRQYNPQLPSSLEGIVLKCLAKQTDDRYPSMSLVTRDLEKIV